MSKAGAAKKDNAYHHGDLKAALRREAEQILVERGVGDIGLREVARRLGVSHNAPYRHYANREALLADIAADGFARLGARYDAIPPGEPTDRIIAIGHAYIRFALEEPAIFRLMLGKDLAKPQYAALKTLADKAFAVLRVELVAFGVAGPAVAQSLALWSMVHGMAVLLLDDRIEEHGGQIDLFEVVTRFTKTYLAGERAQATLTA